MPITRRRRANPPEQPENNNHLAEQSEQAVEVLAAEPLSATAEPANNVEPVSAPEPAAAPEPITPAPTTVATPALVDNTPSYQAVTHTHGNGNGNGNSGTAERNGTERQEIATHPQHPIESGRRTPRGELFRRAPLPPPATAPAPQTPPVQLQPPSHEITLPLGKRPGDTHGDPLHLAYNPGYTGSDEMRSVLLHKLAQECKAGGRARCWSCGSIAIVYDRWNTRSKTFGEIGVAFCEICGVWSVM